MCEGPGGGLFFLSDCGFGGKLARYGVWRGLGVGSWGKCTMDYIFETLAKYGGFYQRGSSLCTEPQVCLVVRILLLGVWGLNCLNPAAIIYQVLSGLDYFVLQYARMSMIYR